MKARHKDPVKPIGQLIDNMKLAYTKWTLSVGDERDREYKWALRGAIEEAMQGCVRTDATSELRTSVAAFLPHLAEYYVLIDSRIDMRISKAIMVMLQDPQAIEVCLTQKNGEKALAWACMQRAVECDLSKIVDKESLVHNTLVHWLGRGLPAPNNPTQADVIGTVYGGHYWTTAFMTIDSQDKTLPNQMWKKGQPILKASDIENMQRPENVSLPIDFSL